MSTPLVSTTWLRENFTDGSNIRIVDVSFPMPGQKIDMAAEFEKSHISGATFFSLMEVRNKDSKFALTLPSPEQFAEHVGKAHGISNNTHVVVYDRNEKFGLFSSCRLWWMLRVFGHSNVSVLDGGFTKWCSESGATASGPSTAPEPGTFVSTFQPQHSLTFEGVAAGLKDKSIQVCDARSPARFNGQAPEPNPKLPSGHMVGSTNLPFFRMLQTEAKVFKPLEEMVKEFENAGIDLSKPLVSTCGSGVTGCALVFAASLAGHQVPMFDGSWTEFVQRADSSQMENLLFAPGSQT